VLVTRGNRIKKAGAKSGKETWLNCTLPPFAGEFFEAISSLQLLEENDSNYVVFCKTFVKT